MMMRNIRNTAERGTLLVEAIAMLGLIAMVTPTLYKKSAERLQEIQDINLATQARTMDSIIQSFVKSHTSHLLSAVPSSSKIELCYYDASAAASGACASDAFKIGYSTTVPSGYKSNDLKHFEPAKVYVYNDDGKLIYYVVYPKKDELGQRRASRLASLIGANGGLVIGSGSSMIVQGVGDSWSLDNSLAHDVGLDNLAANSLVVTSNEPINALEEDSDKYLYRVFDEGAYKNTMTTDLYMGGAFDAGQTTYNSIFNVRRLTLNTQGLTDELHTNASALIPEAAVADLYIGKPTSSFLDTSSNHLPGNNGAAWIYGNISALNENLRAYNTSYDDNRGRSGYDVFELVRRGSSNANARPTTGSNPYVTGEEPAEDDYVFRARNTDGQARVAMLRGFAGVDEAGDADTQRNEYFFVGRDGSSGADEGYLIKAYDDASYGVVDINSKGASTVTYINKKGGTVRINGGEASSSGVLKADTIINEQGGTLSAGYRGDWLYAAGQSSAAQVNILQNVTSSDTGSNVFTVGNSSYTSTANMIYADQQKTSLRGDRLEVRNNGLISNASSNVGGTGLASDMMGVVAGHTLVNTKYTDILGSTYLGARGGMSSGTSTDGLYTRADFTLGVAGSAWVDDLLWAHQIWAQDAGMKNFHAGFSSFASYKSSPTTGWLNVYGDDTGVVIRNRAKINSSSSVYNDDALLIADSARVDINDPTQRAFAHFQDGSTYIGSYTVDKSFDNANLFYADSSEAKVQGYDIVNIRTITGVSSNASRGTNVVNVQDGAMQFAGQAGNGETYGNKILAKTNKMGIKTGRVTAAEEEDDVQFYIDDGLTRLRYNTLEVQDSSATHTAKFRVMADAKNSSSSDANVQINGSFHVTGNDVIHVASNAHNLSGSSDVNNGHATFEVAPDYIQVRAKSGSSYVNGVGNSGYYATFKVDTTDNNYLSPTDIEKNAAVYVRRGAIELETSGYSYNGDFKNMTADQGTGYIKANRFVSNTGKNAYLQRPKFNLAEDGGRYDMYMVNPAYTSVMHDIKLTTRGGARLSDILPDYILKGVYNVSNDYVEGSKAQRIAWSAGSKWSNTLNKNVAWANAYVGKLPYALCPPGYYNMATILPTSFMMGQAGHVVTAKSKGWEGNGNSDDRFYVETQPVQTQILKAAQSNGGRVKYPGLHEVSTYTFMQADANDQDVKTTATLTGWYLGLKNEGEGSSNITKATGEGMQNTTTDQTNWLYTPSGSEAYAVAQPLYFQQNTWLKTALSPDTDGWSAYMGFIYDTTDYDLKRTGVSNEGITSNNNMADGYNESSASYTQFQGYGTGGSYVWNLFPVPTNSIEGHATVYCYFKRSDFDSTMVEQIDQRNSYKSQDSINSQAGRDDGASYRHRLNDPSLKYTDPW
jgi:hypothetical protein